MLDPQDPSRGNPPPAGDPFEGTSYRLMKRLAEGGMSEVYLVEHRELQGAYVAKVLRPELVADARVLERMRVEAHSLAKLSHPNIVSILSFDQTVDGRPFHVLERLRGRTLAQEMAARGYIPVLEAVEYVCQILSALRAVHALGVVHRDIKPDNIFLHDQLSGARVLKILDFGIVKVLPRAARVSLKPSAVPTETGTVVGTPRFMSPEAAVGEPVDPRADLYGTGLILFMLLAGRGPFDELKTDEKLLQAHAAEEPLPPSRFARGPVPPELDRAVLRALAKDPAQRFQTAQEFAKVLGEIHESLVRPVSWAQTIAFSRDRARSSEASPSVELPQERTPAEVASAVEDSGAKPSVREHASFEKPHESSLTPKRFQRVTALQKAARVAAFIFTTALTTGALLWVARWFGG